MAEKKATFEVIMRSLQAKDYAPVYYLMGEESYYIDRISDFIAENVLKEEERDFNQTVVYGSDVTPLQIVEMAKRYPMMAERQVVIVKEAQNLRNTEILEKYVMKPVPTTILVFCHKNGSLDMRKKLATSLLKSPAVIFESKKMREHDLPNFIENYLKKSDVTIDAKSAQIIADSIGADLSRLTSELDKVVLGLNEGERRVTPEVVERQIGVSKDFNAFELRSAIINKDVFKANQIVNYFDKNPKAGSIYSFVPIIFSYFSNLMLCYYAPRKDEGGIAQFLGLKSPWGAKDYVAGMRKYSGMKTMQIIEKIRETDAKSKGLDNPNTPGGELMRELLFFILH